MSIDTDGHVPSGSEDCFLAGAIAAIYIISLDLHNASLRYVP